MLETAPELIIPEMGRVYAWLSPWVEALTRVAVGLLLVPHGLRACFGFFPTTGHVTSFSSAAAEMEVAGYRPGKFWATIAALTNFIAGPLLALGLFTRVAALTVFVFLFLSIFDHARIGGYFCNRNGLEYPLLWTIVALFFMVNGGGAYSLDHIISSREF